MTVNELIEELNTIQDKTQNVYIIAYPEWDDCGILFSIDKDRIWREKNMFLYKKDSRDAIIINAECSIDNDESDTEILYDDTSFEEWEIIKAKEE